MIGHIERIKLAVIITLVCTTPLYLFQSRVHANPNASFQVQVLPAPQCSDGIDNDGDSWTDYPVDPDCTSSNDTDESNPVSTTVVFMGRAYPMSTVTLLKDAQVAITTIAGPDARFTLNLHNLTAGSYLFSIYSEDYEGTRSSLFTFPVQLSQGSTTEISGIYIAPTLSTDKSSVKQGDNIEIFGQSTPNSQITISVHSNQEHFVQTTTDSDGIYLYSFNTAPLEVGQHITKSKSAIQGESSSYSQSVAFSVSQENVNHNDPLCKKSDLNCDSRINLIDFSIAAFWYKRTLDTEMLQIESERLNGDTKIDLIDFSIMAFYWTG